ncbi:LOW QUALITY PROTEIN: kinesin-like protein KIF15 [Xiphophorus hellerii]|uniref:LOW QUALITY PROTEIN: kinesin-like protein KIF15 n=1 Tax=Xiphophorus hellerii TaxID=8084 RepID=UPI0013B35DED|nr:LOW QUALITY PROTEIN: kinesin-like protein KIF15 [Xiphophorus hellerii]
MSSGGKGSGDSTLLAASGDSDSIKVFVRVRPLTQGTGLTTDGDQSLCLNVSSPNTIRLLSKPEPRTFIYDHVADMDTSQDSVFTSVAKNIVESCMNGYNGTIFAYGQTGSGKTFTMLGPSELDNFTDELRGVIPRSFEYLFFLIGREVETSGKSKSFLCKCSFIEIYNEQIYDLLDSASASLFLRENIKKGVFVEGAVEKFVNSASEAYQVLSMGWRNRRVASTSMNRESSRSHAVFTMTLESKESRNEVVNIRRSQLNLVDLAGSERQKDTHAEGSRLKEASSINRSLMCLGQVIMALVDVSNGKSRHICYRESKLTFLLKDSLGGNAKTYIIANVHPGSKCFGETLSTLQFAQRAKLIKNKAVINEDTQGNVKQLQAEVKKLKEQLAQALTSSAGDSAPRGPQPFMGPSVENQQDVLYKGKYMAAVRLWKKQNEEKKILLKKVAQLEEAWTQKDKFIHSSRMIIRFREDHISRLEKKLKAGESSTTDAEFQALIDQLKKEVKILGDQVDHHPKMTRYAAENYSLREENRLLRSLESVIKCEEVSTQVAAELEEAFRKALESEKLTEASTAASTSSATDSASAATIEKLNAKLLQKQSELTAVLQAFEEYKDITKKQLSQLQSDKRYLEKSNRHLENILEATHACKKHEVSELNRIHVETIKILTTPTKAYNLRSRLIPLSSPEHLNGIENDGEDIWSEQPPSDMTEMALTEELRHVQDQVSRVQTQLNEEEMNNSKLLKQIAKLEEQIAVISQESRQKGEQLHAERASRSKDQLSFQETVNALQQSLQSEQQAADVLRSEIQDLRLVLQSSDKELTSVKNGLRETQSEHQQEMSRLSSNLISTQLQLDKVQLEWEQLLEQHRTLQDSFDQLQAEAKFDADQARQELRDRQKEVDQLKAEILDLNNLLQAELQRTSSLMSQVKENKENTSKELVETMEQNTQLRKQGSDLTLQNQNLSSTLADLEQNLTSANGKITSLEQEIKHDKDVLLDLMNQTRDLRAELSHKEENIIHLSGDIEDLMAKYNSACCERDNMREQNQKMQVEIGELKETMEKKMASNKIEVEVLQEEITYATEEVERLTKVCGEQQSLLNAAQEQAAQKELIIKNLEQTVQQQQEAVEKTVRNGGFRPTEATVTPKSVNRTPCGFGSFNRDLTEVLESQERELENRRSSMMTMELLLAELNGERSAKNEEIQRLKEELREKEIVRMEIQGLLEKFYTKERQLTPTGNKNSEDLGEDLRQAVLKQLEEEKAEKNQILQRLSAAQRKLQEQESSFAQSQTCIQELTTELRNRCLELRELNLRVHDEEKLLQENEVLRRQNEKLSEENGKLVGHKNHKQRIEYLVKLKKDNTRLHEENEKLRTEISLMRDDSAILSPDMM